MAEPAWLDADVQPPAPLPRDPPPPPGYVDPLEASSVLDHLVDDHPDGGGAREAGARGTARERLPSTP